METMPLGIVVERRILTSAWQEEAWRPVAVLPGAPAACWRLLDEEPGRTRYLAAVLSLELHRSDAASYRENLLSDTPAVFVSLRRDGGELG
ncbi:MAG: DUF3305 domain-containing protein, partial [Rhodospirillales bacterium]|nr:DUF3305 domain-containing protein [Rhodospirillales bacterium]